ncbi:unnamed protein product [Arctogadus glacialis]
MVGLVPLYLIRTGRAAQGGDCVNDVPARERRGVRDHGANYPAPPPALPRCRPLPLVPATARAPGPAYGAPGSLHPATARAAHRARPQSE